MKLRWTERAASDLEAIHDHVAEDSPRRAADLIGEIIERAEQIREFPHSGRSVPEYENPSIREFVPESYRVVYLAGESDLQVLTVQHAARLLPDDPPLPE